MAPIESPGSEEKEEKEEPPIVKELKELDDRYLKVKEEYERELWKIQAKYTEMQKPLLEERQKVLAGDGEDTKTGTPGCTGFWAQALANWDEEGDLIETHDKPVLQYLKDIRVENLDAENPNKGFKVDFTFVPNEYFTNTVLSKEIHLGDENPWTQEPNVLESKGSTIDWKPGKDVTVEKVKPKPKPGKKKKQAPKETIEPRPSFFRYLARSFSKTGEIPEDAALLAGDEVDEDEKEEFLGFLLSNEYEYFDALRNQLVSFAIRWYTGEAADDKDDDEEGEEESISIGDDSEDDDDDDDDIPKGKGKGKKKGGAKKKHDDSAPDNKKEECKQQ